MSKYKVEMKGYDQYPQFTHQQMMEKLELYRKKHDQSIKEELVLSNLKLVLSLVTK